MEQNDLQTLPQLFGYPSLSCGSCRLTPSPRSFVGQLGWAAWCERMVAAQPRWISSWLKRVWKSHPKIRWTSWLIVDFCYLDESFNLFIASVWFSHRLFQIPLNTYLRLALTCILNSKMDDALCLLAMVCTSYVSINRGTNKCRPERPLGDEAVPSVSIGNCLGARCLAWNQVHSFLRTSPQFNSLVGIEATSNH